MKLAHWLFISVPRAICAVLVLLTVAITGANVVARYVFRTPFFWAEELLTYFMIAFVFLGAILVIWDGAHLRMDILSQRLPARWRLVVATISLTLLVAVCAFMAVQSYTVTSTMWRFGKKSVAAEVPMVIPHATLLICFVGITVVSLLRFRRLLFTEAAAADEANPERPDHVA